MSDIVVYLCILYFLLVLLVSPRPISTARDCLHVYLLTVLHALTCIFCKLGMLHAVGWQFHGTDFGKRKCHTLRSLDSEFMNIWRQKERNRKRRSTLQSDTAITLSDRSVSYYMSWLLWPPYVIGGPLYFCPVVSFLLLSFFYLFFSSPNLSDRRSDVCHTSTHGVALARI